MSGHSKWSTIKRKKGAADAKRGAAFTKLANAITIAAKEGGGDPTMNFTLRIAIDKAKSSNMPSANVERAIKRGTGELADAKALEQITYEGYGPGGVAFLIECLTDNRNRTVSEVRSTLTKRGGSLGETGSVGYLFEKKGVISVAKSDGNTDAVMLAAIDAGASDVVEEHDTLEIETPLQSFAAVKDAIETLGVTAATAELANVASTHLPIEDAAVAGKIVDLASELEELEDVTSVSTNADIDPALISG